MNKRKYPTYRTYLNSKIWKKKRSKILERQSFCFVCCSRKFLNVHHNTYVRIEKEKNYDLVPLCSICHQKLHDTYGIRKKSIKRAHFKMRKEHIKELIETNSLEALLYKELNYYIKNVRDRMIIFHLIKESKIRKETKEEEKGWRSV